MISLDQLEGMFANIADGAWWDMSRPMLWGYFFTDRSSEKLASVAERLEQDGYRYVDLFVPELDEGVEPYFFLHVEKEEVHSPASLHQRNAQFYALAEQYGLDSYDGMDVGPLPG
ncbi:ribonuclease E inhibitor RraB [uncultured Massilia sp.]|uniref:ribonuclease E inhibitor RraB n=1 Tax=uncultured Massilia sp. TaxID=169973 RepID=UPI00258DEF94|nr:ribonuclease E inhibitor RraB [uncultured Massilia sp.]